MANIFGTKKRRFPSWSTANATDLSALVGGLLSVLSEAQQSQIAHEASRIKFSNGAENIQKKKPVEGTHTHTHIISSKFGRQFDLVT